MNAEGVEATWVCGYIGACVHKEMCGEVLRMCQVGLCEW